MIITLFLQILLTEYNYKKYKIIIMVAYAHNNARGTTPMQTRGHATSATIEIFQLLCLVYRWYIGMHTCKLGYVNISSNMTLRYYPWECRLEIVRRKLGKIIVSSYLCAYDSECNQSMIPTCHMSSSLLGNSNPTKGAMSCINS